MISLLIAFLALIVPGYFLRHILGGMVRLYRVVPVNEAHIRILRNKKDVFSSRTSISSYWYIPFITKLHKLPLSNLAIPVNDVKLNDKNMAKFVCDLMCFINIKDLNLAVERLSLTSASHALGFDFTKLSEDLRAIMESIGRTVSAKHSILEIYMNRQAMDTAISKEVEAVFPRWGIELVDLELKDIKDVPNSTIISDIEAKAQADIRRDAEIRIAETQKEAEMKKAEAEQDYRMRQVLRDEEIGKAEQRKNMEIAKAEAEANRLAVEAKRKIDVGTAEIEKQKTEQQAEAVKIKSMREAEGRAEALRVESQAKAEAEKTVGTAEAQVIKAKKVADAEGTDKLAEAMAKFNDAGLNVKQIDNYKDIQIEKAHALGDALKNAELKLVLTGETAKDFFGMNLNAETGVNLQQFLSESGVDLTKFTKKEKNED